MPSRKLANPGSNKSDRNHEKKRQRIFRGVYEDEPANTIPDNTMAKVTNAICQGNNIEPRSGSILFTDLVMPGIEGRSGYAAHKEDDFLVSDAGNIFTEDDVSNLVGWNNGLFDEITNYISATRVRVRDSDYNTGTIYFRGRVNLMQWHSKAEVWVVQLGQEIYTLDRYMTAATKVVIYSRDVPSNTFSEMKEFDDDCFINNSNGLYKVLLTENPPKSYRTNTDIPTKKIEGNEAIGQKKHKYRYFYSMSNIDGFGNFINRNTPAKIQTESGLNAYNYEDVSEGDWSILNTNIPVGKGDRSYGILNGGAGIDTDPLTWAAITDGTIRLNINQLGMANIVLDWSKVVTMDDVASVIQTALRRYFPSGTCEYVADDGTPRMQIASGKGDAGTVALAIEGQGGTPSGDDLQLTLAGGATVTSSVVDYPAIIRGMTIPLYKGRDSTWQWHWKYYSIYRTADYGPDGFHLKTNGKQTVNSPDFIVWVKDVRVAGSFIARRLNGIIEVREGAYGEFEIGDEGAVVEFEDSTRAETIQGGFIDSKHVRYRGTEESSYYSDNSKWQWACVGNGRGARVSKTGKIVTRWPGSLGTTFTDDDVRKPIWWPNGNISYIKNVIDADTFEVWDEIEWEIDTGITLDPTYRNYTDEVNDDVLYGYSANWTAKSRLHVPVAISNLLSRQPGFLLAAARNGKVINYCQTELSYRQFVGYHNQEFQKVILEDKIMALHDFPDRYSALCQGSIYTGVTNNAVELTVQGTLQLIFQLNDPEKVADFGIASKGGIFRIGKGFIRIVTNLFEVMDFDGFNYGQDLTVDKDGLKMFQKAIKDAVQVFVSLYSRATGYLLWFRRDN